jgi:hypothetical protein
MTRAELSGGAIGLIENWSRFEATSCDRLKTPAHGEFHITIAAHALTRKSSDAL